MTDVLLRDHLKNIENATPDNPVVAFFDLDRTLIAGYSIVAMAWERARHGLAQGELRQSTKILRDVVRQSRDKNGGKSGDSYQRLVRRLSKSLQGISEETLTELGKKAYQKHPGSRSV